LLVLCEICIENSTEGNISLPDLQVWDEPVHSMLAILEQLRVLPIAANFDHGSVDEEAA